MPSYRDEELVPDTRKSAPASAVGILITKQRAQSQFRHWDKRKGFYVCGYIEYIKFNMEKAVPLGNGDFIWRLSTELRNKVKKIAGEKVRLDLRKDRLTYPLDNEFYKCLMEEEQEVRWRYWSGGKTEESKINEYIGTAKDADTKAQRIINVLEAFRKKEKFAAMKKRLAAEKKEAREERGW